MWALRLQVVLLAWLVWLGYRAVEELRGIVRELRENRQVHIEGVNLMRRDLESLKYRLTSQPETVNRERADKSTQGNYS